MSISSRITSIEEHLKESYQELEGIGIDTTVVNNNLENIPKLLDGYWETLPKVTDEGTSITLDNTKEGKMKVLLKGNTYQDSTTGKNLLNLTNGTRTHNGLTGIYENGVLTYSGTATSNYATLTTGSSNTLQAGTYTFSIDKTTNLQVRLRFNLEDSTQYNVNVSAGGTNTTFTLEQPAQSYYIFLNNLTSGNTYNGTIKLQLESGSSATSYEPYTNGPSPNPSYPQDIHVVSGDNTITTSKDGFENIELESGYIDSNNVIQSATGWKHSDYIDITGYEYYVVDMNLGNAPKSILYDSNKQPIQVFSIQYQGTYNLSNYPSAKYIRISSQEVYLNKQHLIVKSDYQVNLPIENVLDFDTILDYWGAVYTKENGTYTLTNRGEFYARPYTLNLEVGKTYTLSGVQVAQTSSNLRLEVLKDNNIVAIQRFSPETTVSGKTFTVEEGHTYKIRGNYSTGGYPMIISKPQLEEGTKANSYTPYNTTPIELCKIGTYQDRFIRNSGKNLYNKAISTFDGYVTNDGTEAQSANYKTSDYIPIEPNTTYVTSVMTNPGSNPSRCYYDENKTFISGEKHYGATTMVGTSPNNAKYMRESIPVVDIDKVQIEEGSSATDYEPYGNGDWYLNKQIGKVVLDGSENWTYVNSSFRHSMTNLNTTGNDVIKQVANYFKAITYNSSWSSYDYFVCYTLDGNVVLKNKDITSINDFKTWLSTHNTIVYYVLATPTYTKIEGTLASQLEALNGAKSYTPQTNISQNNNDMASVLNATALSE